MRGEAAGGAEGARIYGVRGAQRFPAKTAPAANGHILAREAAAAPRRPTPAHPPPHPAPAPAPARPGRPSERRVVPGRSSRARCSGRRRPARLLAQRGDGSHNQKFHDFRSISTKRVQ
jgi:hypothetical protein